MSNKRKSHFGGNLMLSIGGSNTKGNINDETQKSELTDISDDTCRE
jgi:hypothetical protein